MRIICGALLLLGISESAALGAVNLIANPGAEQGTGVKPGEVTFWAVGGTSSPGRDDGTFDPGISPHSGNFAFYGGTGTSGTLTQTVDVLESGVLSGTVDAGGATAILDFFQQSLSQGAGDAASMQLRFTNGLHAQIGSLYDSGLVANTGSWLQVTSSPISIPPQTRGIDVIMTFTLRAGSDLDAFIDDASLTVTATPEPTSAAMLLVPAALAAGYRRQRRLIRNSTPMFE